MNWWNRDNQFVKGMRKVPPYFDLFWNLFFEIAPFLGDLKIKVLQVGTDGQIDAGDVVAQWSRHRAGRRLIAIRTLPPRVIGGALAVWPGCRSEL